MGRLVFLSIRALCVSVIVLVSVALLSVWLFGLTFNRTDSLPTGVYRFVNKPIERDDIVVFCPPNRAIFQMAKDRGYLGRGPCLGDLARMMKRVKGLSGDDVHIDAEGVWINHQRIAHSCLLAYDQQGRALPNRYGHSVIPNGQYLLLSDVNPYSFDGRYFGQTAREHIIGVVVPVLTWSRRY